MKPKFLCRCALSVWLSVAAAMVVARAIPQQTVEQGATLHVYTNLLQIPVLILSSKRQELPPIEAENFLLRLGDDPPFHPRVRLEGEDPITLAVLIDGTFYGPRLPQLAESLAAMARNQLHRQDRIAFYGLDGCKLRRTSLLRSPDAEVVRAAVQALEEIPPYQHRWHGEKCDNPMLLWDSVAWVCESLHGEPGRRVVLAITNGEDGGSRLTPDDARRVATRDGVAVFSLAEHLKVSRQNWSAHVSLGGTEIESALAYITEFDGGMVMETTRNNVDGTLAHFTQLLRGRYILEFSRPKGLNSDRTLNVSVGQPRDFIRSAGTSLPTAEPEAPDPSVEHGKLSDVHDVADSAPATEKAEPQTPEPNRR